MLVLQIERVPYTMSSKTSARDHSLSFLQSTCTSSSARRCALVCKAMPGDGFAMRKHNDVHRAPYEEAKSEVEAKLRKQKLTKPMTEKEMEAFCQVMVRNLDLKPSAFPDVRGWAQAWQITEFGSPRE